MSSLSGVAATSLMALARVRTASAAGLASEDAPSAKAPKLAADKSKALSEDAACLVQELPAVDAHLASPPAARMPLLSAVFGRVPAKPPTAVASVADTLLTAALAAVGQYDDENGLGLVPTRTLDCMHFEPSACSDACAVGGDGEHEAEPSVPAPAPTTCPAEPAARLKAPLRLVLSRPPKADARLGLRHGDLFEDSESDEAEAMATTAAPINDPLPPGPERAAAVPPLKASIFPQDAGSAGFPMPPPSLPPSLPTPAKAAESSRSGARSSDELVAAASASLASQAAEQLDMDPARLGAAIHERCPFFGFLAGLSFMGGAAKNGSGEYKRNYAQMSAPAT